MNQSLPRIEGGFTGDLLATGPAGPVGSSSAWTAWQFCGGAYLEWPWRQVRSPRFGQPGSTPAGLASSRPDGTGLYAGLKSSVDRR